VKVVVCSLLLAFQPCASVWLISAALEAQHQLKHCSVFLYFEETVLSRQRANTSWIFLAMITPYMYGKYKAVNLYMVEMFKKACFLFFGKLFGLSQLNTIF